MSDKFRPMLAIDVKGDLEELFTKPTDKDNHHTIQPKMDGIRAISTEDGTLLSRTLKPIPNKFIQATMKRIARFDMAGLDGELVTYTDGKLDPFNTIQSKVMSEDGEPEFKFIVFDYACPDLYFSGRRQIAEKIIDRCKSGYLYLLNAYSVYDPRDLLISHECFKKDGAEGTMFRTAFGKYKFGRSTWKEQYLVKIKDFHDDEATVVGFVEQMKNNNEKEKDNFGLAKRSSKKSNLVGKDTLGALVVDYKGNLFQIGTGYDDATRKEIWDNQAKYLNQLVKFKYQEISVDQIPRFPVFLGFRSPEDL